MLLVPQTRHHAPAKQSAQEQTQNAFVSRPHAQGRRSGAIVRGAPQLSKCMNQERVQTRHLTSLKKTNTHTHTYIHTQTEKPTTHAANAPARTHALVHVPRAQTEIFALRADTCRRAQLGVAGEEEREKATANRRAKPMLSPVGSQRASDKRRPRARRITLL
eukprot:TRINITY_DN1184_c0_g2_i1.p1 TRINITY_DN1184_c0_g2~~TRINITY_DN1184_c0_g2_i1.p1  ORF type:complete len:162 (-),score=20.84 TRINITY_DN1184_c0_g2_i1:331-816(-)